MLLICLKLYSLKWKKNERSEWKDLKKMAVFAKDERKLCKWKKV